VRDHKLARRGKREIGRELIQIHIEFGIDPALDMALEEHRQSESGEAERDED
jgi:hypothetical protein